MIPACLVSDHCLSSACPILTPACLLHTVPLPFLLPDPCRSSSWPLPVFCLTPACFLPDPCLSSALFLSVFYLYCCLSSAWLKRFACEKKRIAPITLFSWAMGANHSRSLFCKERQEWFTLGHKKGKNSEKLLKHMTNVNFFERIARFWEPIAQITSKSLMSLFFTERFTHDRSFVKSDKSDSLTVAYIKKQWEQLL